MTEFKLLCDESWFNALLTSMGLLGPFFGDFITGMYTDRFGRKNAMLVWSAVCMACLVIHAFMPEKYSFMTMRTLGNGASVSLIKPILLRGTSVHHGHEILDIPCRYSILDSACLNFKIIFPVN